MSFINYSSREINCKLVYYGPGLCGKTTNLQYIYAKTSPDAKGKMISLATETERTLFFDFLPLSLGEIRGFKTRFHLYTVPGQVFYDASRKLILKGVDGVVFVVDSQIERMEANIESLDNLRTNLGEQGYDLDKLPYVIQYNKRDLPNAAPIEQLRDLAEPDEGARVRGLRDHRRRRVRHAEGRRQGRPDRAQARLVVAVALARPGRGRGQSAAKDGDCDQSGQGGVHHQPRPIEKVRNRPYVERRGNRGEQQRPRDAEPEARQRPTPLAKTVEQHRQPHRQQRAPDQRTSAERRPQQSVRAIEHTTAQHVPNAGVCAKPGGQKAKTRTTPTIPRSAPPRIRPPTGPCADPDATGTTVPTTRAWRPGPARPRRAGRGSVAERRPRRRRPPQSGRRSDPNPHRRYRAWLARAEPSKISSSASGFVTPAPTIRAATPATCGDAIDVPMNHR